MYRKKSILAIIPARGGSKGIPGKNIKPIAGKPLIAWSIQAAQKSRLVDEILVTTDDPEIAAVARRYGADVPFLRPGYLASDEAKSIDVIFHAINYLADHGRIYDYIILLEPTSPLREPHDIDNSIKILINNKVGAVSIVGISRVEAAHPVFDVTLNREGFLRSYLRNFKKAGRRQDISELYFFEGTVYVSKVKELFKRKSFYHKKCLGYIVPKWKAPELDDETDFIIIEALLKHKQKTFQKSTNRRG